MAVEAVQSAKPCGGGMNILTLCTPRTSIQVDAVPDKTRPERRCTVKMVRTSDRQAARRPVPAVGVYHGSARRAWLAEHTDGRFACAVKPLQVPGDQHGLACRRRSRRRARACDVYHGHTEPRFARSRSDEPCPAPDLESRSQSLATAWQATTRGIKEVSPEARRHGSVDT